MTKQHRKKYSWDPYTSDVQKFSIYPQVNKYEHDNLKEGSIIEVIVTSSDPRGNGIALYKGKRVIMKGGSVGSKVRVKVTKVLGDTIYGEIAGTLTESGVEY
ncbi:MAG: TRAM domain-containing protein [Desulfurococcaceae archaeon]